ncbi:MAG TPA: hypothetical protein VFK57_24985 [Vicinamibacterales bacterium]|nr:hypothetical protein [Vicinamibacterales bacterium]
MTPTPRLDSIDDTLADGPLQLADLIRGGLAANDRIKYYLTLLQAVAAHAGRPFAAVPDLRAARAAAGVTDAALDEAVALSQSLSDTLLVFPGAERVRAALFADMRRMLEPLRAAPPEYPGHTRLDSYVRRLEACAAEAPVWQEDQVDVRAIEALTRVGDETFHRLVMDVHKELNALLASVAVESIDGARVLGVAPQDRPLIAAFMKGLNATAGLKFDHPGLGTTAARSRDALSIQNDLGTTDGHVIVIRVAGLTAGLTYADVHRKRLLFLQETLSPYGVEWREGPLSRTDELETIVGDFAAPGQAELEQFLTFVASRLVFLIDWNRARKQLGRFVSRREAVRVLKWAADNQFGHRAFLQAGGAQLISSVFDRIAPNRTRYGLRLDELIGADAATAFLESVLRIATTALNQGRSVRLIADQVEVELARHLATPAEQLIEVVAEHAMLISALIERLQQTLGSEQGLAIGKAAQTAALAARWEERADAAIAGFSRTLARSAADAALQELLDRAQPVAGALEECAFVLTLASADVPPAGIASLRSIAELVGTGARDYVRALEHAKALRAAGPAAVDEVLIAVDRITALEHAVDAAERSARAVFLDGSASSRDLHVLTGAARCLEDAADGLARCATAIRDHALGLGGGHL